MNGYMQIIQIIPAGEWFALYANFDCTDYVWVPLVCWALIEKDDRQYITGMVVDDGGSEIRPAGNWVDYHIGYFTEMPDADTIKDELRMMRELHEELAEELAAEKGDS